MLLRDVMTKRVECADPFDSVHAVARKMKDLDVGSIPVCENDRLVGMVTDRDLVIRCLAEGLDPNTWTRDVMTPDVVYAYDDQPLEVAERMMQLRQIRRLLVLDRTKRLVGIVSLGDLAVRTHDPEHVAELLHDVSDPLVSRC
jgi:CBS domain-containing protein